MPGLTRRWSKRLIATPPSGRRSGRASAGRRPAPRGARRCRPSSAAPRPSRAAPRPGRTSGRAPGWRPANSRSSSASCACSAATVSFARPVSPAWSTERPTPRSTLVAPLTPFLRRPRNAPRIEEPSEIAVCTLAPRACSASRLTACSALRMRSCSVACLARELAAQLLDGGVAFLARRDRQAVAEVALALARQRRLLEPRALVDRHLLRPVEPVAEVLRPRRVGALRARGGRDLAVARLALGRRAEIAGRDAGVDRAVPRERHGAVGERREQRHVGARAADAHARAADRHRDVVQRRAGRSGAAPRHVVARHVGRDRGGGRAAGAATAAPARRCRCGGYGGCRGGGGVGERRGSRCAAGHQRPDLVAGQRPAQVREREPRLEHDRRGLVHVVHQEHALAEPGDGLLHLRRGRTRRSPPAPSRPSSSRCLSRSACSRPISQVPAFERPL